MESGRLLPSSPRRESKTGGIRMRSRRPRQHLPFRFRSTDGISPARSSMRCPTPPRRTTAAARPSPLTHRATSPSYPRSTPSPPRASPSTYSTTRARTPSPRPSPSTRRTASSSSRACTRCSMRRVGQTLRASVRCACGSMWIGRLRARGSSSAIGRQGSRVRGRALCSAVSARCGAGVGMRADERVVRARSRRVGHAEWRRSSREPRRADGRGRFAGRPGPHAARVNEVGFDRSPISSGMLRRQRAINTGEPRQHLARWAACESSVGA